jgi:hypothetical protein
MKSPPDNASLCIKTGLALSYIQAKKKDIERKWGRVSFQTIPHPSLVSQQPMKSIVKVSLCLFLFVLYTLAKGGCSYLLFCKARFHANALYSIP